MRMRSRNSVVAALVAASALTLTACGSDAGDKPVATVSGGSQSKAIITLDTPREKPDLVLTDSNGEKYDLIEKTKGHPTLIYFGYTNCPDACPMIMGNLAVAMKKLTPEERDDLRVVMVTSDPERDTPARLKEWLGMIDKKFIGLTGDFDTIKAGADAAQVGIEAPEKKKNGDIVSTHGLEVLMTSPKDDKVHWLGMERATPEDYIKAIPKIIKGQNP